MQHCLDYTSTTTSSTTTATTTTVPEMTSSLSPSPSVSSVRTGLTAAAGGDGVCLFI